MSTFEWVVLSFVIMAVVAVIAAVVEAVAELRNMRREEAYYTTLSRWEDSDDEEGEE